MSRRSDLTTPPDLRRRRHLGAARTQRPVYDDLLPPCNHACPAGENIQGWLAHAEAGRFREAWEAIMLDNPLPAVHGRVCYHPCESVCNRGALDSAVSIHAVERFLGDLALEEGWVPERRSPPSGQRVLVVGAGPSGLSAAYHLVRLGHTVEIREAGPVAGGMMHFGIPAYRLPRRILDAEVQRIERLGVRIVLDHRVDDLAAERERGGFDAVFVAVGAHLSKKVDIPACDATRIRDAIGFLRDAEQGREISLGRRVAIYGGGNTAMDAARVATRLGFEPLIVYRRDRDHMPAHPSEADEALEEGVKIHWLRTIRAMDEEGLTVEQMEIDEQGKPQPTGHLERLRADDLILALGQDADTGFLRTVPGVQFEIDGTVVVDSNMMTGAPGVFAGGDMVPAERTVTVAVGHGKRAARSIDAYLRGGVYTKPDRGPIATVDKLRLWFHADTAAAAQPRLDPDRRRASFAEVTTGLGRDEAVHEAQRCLSCGNCFECDGCYAACPEDAVIKLGTGLRYRFDYDRCTGCAVCFEQCPCHAIQMVPEPPAQC